MGGDLTLEASAASGAGFGSFEALTAAEEVSTGDRADIFAHTVGLFFAFTYAQ